MNIAKTKARALYLAILVPSVIAAVCFFALDKEKTKSATPSPRRPKPVSRVSKSGLLEPVSESVSAISSKVKTGETVRSAKTPDEPFTPSISEEDFGDLLAATKADGIATRNEAWRAIDSLGTAEKIHWIRIFSKSDDETMRTAALKATRICFGMENFQRKTKTTYKDLRRRRMEASSGESGDDPNVIEVSFESLPTKREAAQINSIVCSALKDESSKVKEEAMLAAASFDVDTSHTIYQYAMTSCDDDVRLAVLREAEYGDDDFRLRLQMAALDLGGEEVVKVASEGIEKATGQRFANSAEAFEWYEQNRTSTEDK